MEEIQSFCCYIWQSKNQGIFGQQQLPPLLIVQKAQQMVGEFWRMQNADSMVPPVSPSDRVGRHGPFRLGPSSTIHF